LLLYVYLCHCQKHGWKNDDLKKFKKSDFFFSKIRIFAPWFYQIFETGPSAQSHKQHGRHASAISSYTLAEQKVSKQQLKFLYLGYVYDAFQHNIN